MNIGTIVKGIGITAGLALLGAMSFGGESPGVSAVNKAVRAGDVKGARAAMKAHNANTRAKTYYTTEGMKEELARARANAKKNQRAKANTNQQNKKKSGGKTKGGAKKNSRKK